jgi:hypothetical protein
VALGFFRRRKERESAIPQGATDSSASVPSFARSDAPVVGGQVGGGGPAGFDFGSLGGGNVSGLEAIGGLAGLGAMLQQASAQGNIRVTQQEPRTVDASGSGALRDEIVGIMKQHGIDPESGAAENVDAGAYGDIQRQMLEALQRHGIDLGASGGFQVQIETDEPGK